MRGLSIALRSLVMFIACSIGIEFIAPWTIPEAGARLYGTQADLRTLQEAVRRYERAHGSLPMSLQDLTHSGEIERLPNDLWGSAFAYSRVEGDKGFVLYSFGADSVDQKGKDDDIVTWEKEYDCETYGTNCPPEPIEIARLVSALLFLLSLAVSIGFLADWAVRQRSGGNAT